MQTFFYFLDHPLELGLILAQILINNKQNFAKLWGSALVLQTNTFNSKQACKWLKKSINESFSVV